MLPIVFFTSKRIFKHYTGFSFFIFVWISRLEKDSARLIRHEKIHFVQQLELLFIFHWLLYGTFYLISRLKGQRHYIGYRFNPFELEAYDHDRDDGYLKRRKPYAWIHYWKEFRESWSRDLSDRIPKNGNINFD